MTTRIQEQFDDAKAVTPVDGADIGECRGLYIGGTGDVAIVTASSNTVTFKAVPVGTILKVAVSQVKATGTTATNIVSLY